MLWTIAVCLVFVGASGTQGNTEVKSLHITSNIKTRYATTQVSRRVVNTGDNIDEASFFVSFPDTAFVTEFVIEAKDKVLKAELKKNEDVKDLDTELGDQLTVFVRDSSQFGVLINVSGHEEVTFKLTYEELLSRKVGVYSNVINVFPQQIVDELKVVVNIEEPTTITNLEVPEFRAFRELLTFEENKNQNELAKIEDKSPTSKQIVWEPTVDQQKAINVKGVRGRFVVKYDVDRMEHAEPFLVDDGYFFANFFTIDGLPKLKQHYIFVVDYSYSMEGKKLDAVKEAKDKVLTTVDPNDYFSLVLVQSFTEVWSPTVHYRVGPETQKDFEREHMMDSKNNITQTLSAVFLIESTPANVEPARKYMQDAELGESFLEGGLKTSLELAALGSEHWKAETDPPQPIIMFLSDGQPTVGEVNTDTILAQFESQNVQKVPMYTLAFGYFADFDFLHKLSLNHFGVTQNIYEADDGAEQLLNFWKVYATPILSNVEFTYLPTKVDTTMVTKSEFKLYFKGTEHVVAGQLNKAAVAENDTIGELSADSSRTIGTQKYSIPVGKKISGHSIEKIFGYLKLRELLDIANSLTEGEEREKAEEMVQHLAMEYSFVTPYTSLVIEKPDGSKSAVEFSQLRQPPPLDKTEMKKVYWLKEFMPNDTAAEVPVTIKDHTYNLALNATKETFGSCKVRFMVGECRHFQKCALTIFEDYVDDFLPFKCDIPGNYLGACCPFYIN